MSNLSLSASHQVSISHDPLEDNASAGAGRRPDMRSAHSSAKRPFVEAPDLRPALLAGAIGLFAAWLVSGMNAPRTGRRPNAARDLPRNLPRDLAQHQSSFVPEGQSSREDFALDAMNP